MIQEVVVDDMLDRTVALIARSGKRTATAASRFTEDLQFDSIDLLHLVADLEEEFGVVVTEDHLRTLHTVGDAVSVLRTLRNGGTADA